MSRKRKPTRFSKTAACLVIVGSTVLASTGCQVAVNGQTLPSPWYLQDDVQYFPSGPEFKLSREAAALRAAEDQDRANRR